MLAQEKTTPTHRWEAPGPGSWGHDSSHIAGTVPPYSQELLAGLISRGFSRGFRAYGVPLEGMEVAYVGQHVYGRMVPVGAPRDARPNSAPPPPLIFKLLFKLHPELRQREQNAAAALVTRRWRHDYSRWQKSDYPRLKAALLALQSVDPSILDDTALRAHLAAARDLLTETGEMHFALIPATSLPVGDWLAHTSSWAKVSPQEALFALKGSSAVSIAPTALLDSLAATVVATPGANEIVRGDGDPGARLEQLRTVSPAVAAALAAYLDEHGNRTTTGLTIGDKTLNEMPTLMLKTLAATLDRWRGDSTAAATDEQLARLRERVPQQHQAEYDALLIEARRMYGFRDEHVGLMPWSSGLLRRALLVAGRKLAGRGRVAAPEHLLEASPAEVDALLGYSGVAPSRAELFSRAEERRRLELEEMPAMLGDARGAPPPLDLMPKAMARVARATMIFSMMLSEDASAPKAPGPIVSGQGVSPGRYSGRARLVLGAADFDKIVRGDVLIARTTSPTYNILLPLLGAVVTDRGGALCHAAVVAREFGIPAVVGAGDATTRIPDGSMVLVDGERGTVEVLP